MRIAHLTASINVASGGLGRVVLGLAQAQAHAGHDVTVHTLEAPQLPDIQTPSSALRILPNRAMRMPGFAYSPTLIAQVMRARPDVIHSHGLWTYDNYSADYCAHHLRIPHVCAPHGMLDAWALQQYTVVKRLFSALWQRRVLARAACLHALVEEERAAIRDYGLSNPVAMIQNGVDGGLLDIDTEKARAAFLEAFPALANQKIALFLSRLHPKKGLINLVRAWKQLGTCGSGWQLVIAGPDELGHAREVEAEVMRLNLRDQVTLLGAQSGDAVWNCYAAAEFLVLPSFSEGFSMAVLEALALGTPVCISTACHFPTVAEVGCGIIFEPTLEALTDALRGFLQMDAPARAAMGASGRALIRRRYTWGHVSAQVSALYTWLLDRTQPPPSFVQP